MKQFCMTFSESLKTFLRKQESSITLLWIPAYAGMIKRIDNSSYFFFYFFYRQNLGTKSIM